MRQTMLRTGVQGSLCVASLLLSAATGAAQPSAASFYTVTPCRAFDSRDPAQGPALAGDIERIVQIGGVCGVPAEATSVAFTIAVIQPSAAGHLPMYAAGGPVGLPVANFNAGVPRTSNGVVRLSAGGQVALRPHLATPGTVHVILDLHGYFVEDEPPAAVPDSATVTEDDGATTIDVLANDTDPDGGTMEIAAVTQPAHGTVAITGGGASLTYQPAADYCNAPPGTDPDTFTYSLSPGSSSATVSVAVVCVNDPPVLAGAGSVAFTEGGAAVAVAPSLQALDVDDTELASATVTLVNPLDGAAETLGVTTAGTAITAVYTAPVLSLSGADSLANYEAVLRSVTYANSADAPDTTARTVSFVVNDGDASSLAETATVTIDAVDDPPTVTAGGGTPAFTEDGPAVVVDGGLTIADPDDTTLVSAAVTLTNLSDPGEETLAATTAGTSIVAAWAAPTLSLSGTDSLANYQAVLRSVAYANTSQDPDPTPRTVSFTVAGDEGASAPATTTVTVAPVNDAPVVTAGGASPIFTEDEAPVAVDPSIVLADVDDTLLAGATVRIVNLLDAGAETLTATTAGTAIAASWAAPVLSLSGSDTLANYQAVLRGVRYANSSQRPTAVPARTIEFRIDDGEAPSAVASTTVTVVPLNDTPVLGGATGGTYTEGDGPLAIAAALTLSDADHDQLTSASVTITNLQDAGAEALQASTGATAITAVYSAPTLSLSGADTVANYQAVLRTVTYRNTSEAPSVVTRTIAFAASDGVGSASTSASVGVVAVNDQPVPATNPVTYATAGNTQLHVAGDTLAGVASIADSQTVIQKASPSDIDGPAALTVVAASGTTANGGQFVLDADGSFTYVPAAGYTGTDSFDYEISDGLDSFIATVQIAVGTPIWYVRDTVDAQNPAGGDGRSTDAFETLAAAEAAAGEGHTVFVFAGGTDTDPLDGGIELANGQKLIGEAEGLTVAPHGTIVPAGSAPRVFASSGNAVTVAATTGPRTGIEVRGLTLQAAGHGVSAVATGVHPVGVTVARNTIQAGLIGVHLQAAAAASFDAVVQQNAITAPGSGIDARSSAGAVLAANLSANVLTAGGTGLVVDGSAGGLAVVTGLADNVVNGATGGSGIWLQAAVLDAVPGGTLQPLAGGVTTIGASGDPVGGSGLVLSGVTGAIDFVDLDAYAGAGAALQVAGSGAFTGSAGTQLTVSDDAAALVAAGGPAVDVANLTLRLVAGAVASNGSPTSGVRLAGVVDGAVAARFSAPDSGLISAATGTAFDVNGGNASISWAGSIFNTTGRAVSLTGWAGDDAGDDIILSGPIDDAGAGLLVSGNAGQGAIAFTGVLTIHPLAGNIGFSASGNTNAGGLRATASGNTAETQGAAALSVVNTPIAAGGLNFRRLAANGGSSGIVLNNTGNLAGLTVSGSGAAGSGGLIQNMSGDGISLVSTRDVVLNWLTLTANGGSGIAGDDVTGFRLADSTITGSGNTANGTEAGLRFQELLGSSLIARTTITNSSEDNIRLTPTSGALDLTITQSTIGPNSATTGGNGLTLFPGGSASTNLVVSSTLFQSNRGAALALSAAGTGSHAVTATGNTLANNGRGLSIATSGLAPLGFEVAGNTQTGTAGTAVEVLSAADTPPTTTVIGRVTANTIGTAGVAGSGSRDAYGIGVDLRGDERAVVSVTGNIVRHTDLTGLLVTDADFGVLAGAPGDSDVTVRDNQVSAIEDDSGTPCGAPWGTRVDFRHTTQGCLDLANNASAQSPSACLDNAHFRVRQRDSSTVLFERLSDGDGTPGELITDGPTLTAHVVGQNQAGSTANVLFATGFSEAANGVCVKP